jgi:type IV fimbrial biogenesis protein FimT
VRHLNATSAAARAERGLTLIEVVVALAIASMLMLVGMPYFGEYNANARLREAGTNVYTDALLAQGEAIKRNRTVRLTSDGSIVQVLDMSNADNPAVIRTRTLDGGVVATELTVDFRSTGRPALASDGSLTDHTLDFSFSGAACSSDIRCPGLRIDAGGGVRVCGNKLSCN